MRKNLDSALESWPELFRVGGVLWLDFANSQTLERLNVGNVLESHDSVESWLGARFERIDLGELRSLREAYVSAASHFQIESEELNLAVERTNQILMAGSGRDQVRKESDRFQLVRVSESPLEILARSFARFLVEGDLSRVRKCSEPTCTLYFFDESKAGRRKWCSMSLCGNRAKATNHYRKTRSSAAV